MLLGDILDLVRTDYWHRSGIQRVIYGHTHRARHDYLSGGKRTDTSSVDIWNGTRRKLYA